MPVKGNQKSNVVKGKDGVHKFAAPGSIPLSLFADRFMLFSGRFRPLRADHPLVREQQDAWGSGSGNAVGGSGGGG